MAIRIPLVIGADGLAQQLQNGDTLAELSLNSEINTDPAALTICQPVYIHPLGGVRPARANAKSTSAVVGLVADVTIAAAAVGFFIDSDTFTATTAQWDAQTGDTGGLVPGAVYFLDTTAAGKLVRTPVLTPGTGACLTRIGRAISATEMAIQIEDPILL